MRRDTKKSISPRVLLADDHQSVLDAESQILGSEFDIVGAVRNGAAVLRAVRELNPDIVALDITMPEINGLEVARRLTATGSRAKIVFLTVHGDLDFVSEALKAGASGYVVKGTMASDLLPAIHAALKGGQFISPSLRFGNASRPRT